MNAEEFKRMTKALALNSIHVASLLPKTVAGDVLGRQLIRSASSVGANYRAACRARSRAEFLSKMGIVEEESDETVYWLELIEESNLLSSRKIPALKQKTEEILSMVVASIKTARRRKS
jgi:four helix bundle protein